MTTRTRCTPLTEAAGHTRTGALTCAFQRRFVPAAHSAPTAERAILLSLPLARTGLGTAYLIFPARAASISAGQDHNAPATWVARILGVRHLAQALATSGQPTSAVLALGAEVDATHAASMLALGLVSRRWRRAALRDAVLAASLAAAGVIAARRAPAAQAPLALRDRLAAWLARWLVPGSSSRDDKPSQRGTARN